MYKRFFLLLLIFTPFALFSQKTTTVFEKYNDTTVLRMDIYSPQVKSKGAPCVIFVFGGGFKFGKRDAKLYQPYFDFLNEKGYVVASIDYRLGLKTSKIPTVFNRKPLTKAIEMAVEDLFKATNHLIAQADEYGIDTAKIILSGSSAGAMTVLQAEYENINDKASAQLLPHNFKYAGVIAFAGAIYSTNGKPEFNTAPAPILFFHGDKDDLVPYNKISLFGTGVYGPKVIAKRMKKNHQPYFFHTFENQNHEISMIPMKENLAEIETFIREFVLNKKPLYIDLNEKNDEKPYKKWSLKSLYNRNISQ